MVFLFVPLHVHSIVLEWFLLFCRSVLKAHNTLTRSRLTHSMKTLRYVEILARMDMHGISLERGATSLCPKVQSGYYRI